MSERENERSWWPMGIVAGLGVVFVANAIMITFALTNPSVMVSEDPYADALAYDRVIAERDAAKALGWSVELSPCDDDTCTVTMLVRDAQGRMIQDYADEYGIDVNSIMESAGS